MTLDELICKMEIQDLIYNHARHLDNHEFEQSKEFYTPDGVIAGPTGDVTRAFDMPLETMQKQSSNLKPRLLTSVTVTPTGPGTAKAFAYCTVRRDFLPNWEWRYDFVKTDKGWRCRRMEPTPIEQYEGELAKVLAEAAAKAKQSA